VANYPDTIHLSGINYNTEDPLHISQIEDHLEGTSGTDLAIKSNKHDVRLLYGSLKYKTISYWASPDSNQANTYNFDIHFDKNPRTNLKVGIHYDNVFSVGIVTNFTTHDFLVKKSRMKLKLDISPNFKGEIELLKHLGKKNYFNVLVDYSYMNLNTPIFSDGDLSEYIRNSIHQFTAKFQTNKTLNSKLGVGYYYLQYNGKSLVGNETLKNIKLRNSHDILFAEFHFNSLNKNYHPTWGSQLSLRTDFVMSNIYKIKYPDDQEYLYFPVDSVLVPLNEQQMNDFISDSLTPSDSYINVFIKYKQIFRISKKIKFITNIGTAVTIGPTDNTEIYRSFNTGGNVHLFYFDYQAYGLNYNENQSNNLAILRADLMYSPIKNLFVYAGANYMAFKESGLGRKVPTQGNYIDSELFGYGINLAYKTPVGPIEVGASMNDNDSSVRWNFQIGFQF
jgi:NTE family protein